MHLSQLFNTTSKLEIDTLTSDSRTKTYNGLYFALPGLTVNGHKYIQQAIQNGAVAIVHHDPIKHIQPTGVEFIQVDDVRASMHRVSSVFYDYPEDKLSIHAITGTNGKTTIAKTLYDISKSLKIEAGYIGTLSIEYASHYEPSVLTTPDTLQLKAIYADMVKHGVKIVYQEISSQGLDLGRVDPCHFTTKSFTNLSHDHLDHHKSMDEYFKAKQTLFERSQTYATHIINADSDYGQKLTHIDSSVKVITYGIHNPSAQYKASNICLLDDKTTFTLHLDDNQSYKIITSFVAEFNVYNILNVIAVLHAHHKIPITTLIEQLKYLPAVPGRMNLIKQGQGYSVVVDYAHTPDALYHALTHLRSMVKTGARLIVVLGSSGGRDALKRPMMGHIASDLADLAVFTEDDPRKESLQSINASLASQVEQSNWISIHQRMEAIGYAIKLAKPGDAIAILGKGTDTLMYRKYGAETYLGDHIIAKHLINIYKHL